MRGFPRTYHVVRNGAIEAVFVENHEALVMLRTELELLRQFDAGASQALIGLLQEQLSKLQSDSAVEDSRIGDIEDMTRILSDAIHPATLATTKVLDSDFPWLQTQINLEAIKQEKERFCCDVAKQMKALCQAVVEPVNEELNGKNVNHSALIDHKVEVVMNEPQGNEYQNNIVD